MKVVVWGIGKLGEAVSRRLVSSPYVTELTLVSGRPSQVQMSIVDDIIDGLAGEPTCSWVEVISHEQIPFHVAQADLIVLTLGGPVPDGGDRYSVYSGNRQIFLESVAPMLEGFPGIVLVVSNPVDLLTLDLYEACSASIPSNRIIGLGTLVDTLRLQSALAKATRPPLPPRSIRSIVVGSHDENCVVMPLDNGRFKKALLKRALGTIVGSPERIRRNGGFTCHPVITAVDMVVREIAVGPQREIPVSVRDPESGLYYSVPVFLRKSGLFQRPDGFQGMKSVSEGLLRCQAQLRAKRAIVLADATQLKVHTA